MSDSVVLNASPAPGVWPPKRSALADRRITDLRRTATGRGLQLHQEQAFGYASTVHRARQVIDDAALSDAAAREQLRLLLPTAPLRFPSKAAATRYCLAEDFRRVQRLLQQLLSLAIAGEPEQPILRALAYLRRRYAALRTFRRYPKPADLDTLVPGCWVGLVNRPQPVAAGNRPAA